MRDHLAFRNRRSPLQGSLFPFLERNHDLHQAKCWLAIPEAAEHDRTLNALTDRRHIIVEPNRGASAVNDLDLVLLLDVGRQRLLGLGPDYLRETIPTELTQLGLGYWLRGDWGTAVTPLAGRRAALSCIAFEFRPGRAPAIPEAQAGNDIVRRLLDELRQGADRAPDLTEEYLTRTATSAPDSLRGLLNLEAGAAILGDVAGLGEHDLKCALRFFENASNHLAAAGHKSAFSASQTGIDTARRLLFERRQLTLNLRSAKAALGKIRPAQAQMGYRLHTMFALPLPPILLIDAPRKMRAFDERRTVLFETRVTQTALRRLLSATAPEGMVASVRTDAEAKLGAIGTPKVRAGEKLRLTALLDSALHQSAHVPSKLGESLVLVEAVSNSVEITPRFRETRTGYPVHFGVVGNQSGKHKLQFTFLTRSDTFSRVDREIQISSE